MFGRLQEVDAGPTSNLEAAANELVRDSREIIERWKSIEQQDIPGLKQQFKQSGLPDLNLTGRQIKYHSVSDELEDEEDEDPRTKP